MTEQSKVNGAGGEGAGAVKKSRVLSGVQPSGVLHLGNYLGAMKQHIDAQGDNEVFVFLADLHALTTVHDAEKLREFSRNAVLDYLALGLDPAKTAIYRQSDLGGYHAELAWVLSCVTGMGLLERAHSYKDKVARGIVPSVGLFFYPVLMAADILLYKADMVPVGPDQRQHLEMTRDMAKSFNERYGETFVIPREKLVRGESVPGTDGEKMSKSFGNTIDIFMEEAELKRVINKKIVTDSLGVEDPKSTDATVWKLYALVEEDDGRRAEREAQFTAGGVGYGMAKKWLLEGMLERFGAARARRAELAANLDYVEQVLREGAERVRPIAEGVMGEVRAKTGIAWR